MIFLNKYKILQIKPLLVKIAECAGRTKIEYAERLKIG